MKSLILFATLFFFCLLSVNAQPGKIDSSFGYHGIVSTGLGKNYSYESPFATDILMLPGGSMYVLQGALTKRLANGALDSSFGVDGYAADARFIPTKAALQSDGKILVTGYTDIVYDIYQHSKSDFAIARYNTNGSLDSSFSGDGKETTDYGEPDAQQSLDRAYSVAVQKDGKIVVAGLSNFNLALAVYNTDGSPDNTFDGDGKLTNSTVTTLGAEGATLVIIQKDGKIVAAGGFYYILRYNTAGSLDKTFNGNGIVETGLEIRSAAIQTDGKIIVAGSEYNELYNVFALARYNTAGGADISFSDDGTQTTDFGKDAVLNAIAIHNDGKIVVAGDLDDGAAFALVQYNWDGGLDKSFSGDGKQITTFGTAIYGTRANCVNVQSDGKIVAGGGSANSYVALAKYKSDGRLDSTFDHDGKLTDGFHAGNTVFQSVAIQKDGKSVGVGRTWNGSNFDFAVVRFNTDGRPDNTFGNDGKQITDFTSKDDYANAVAIQSDGKILVAGYTGIYGSTIISVARYNTDGSPDSAFSTDGKVQTDFGFMINEANAVVIQSDEKIVVAGKSLSYHGYIDYDYDFAIVRYNTDGSLDRTFDKDGKRTVRFVSGEEGNVSSLATSAVMQNDGKIVVGGVVGQIGHKSSAFVIRINPDGSLDSTYSTVKQPSFSGNDESCSIAIQKDGKVVRHAYYYSSYGGFSLTRRNTDGTLDKSFGEDGRKVIDYPLFQAIPVRSLALQTDGKIVVGGARLFRFNTNGSIDSAFGTDGAQATAFYANSVAIAGTKLYAVGADKYNGAVAKYLLNNSNTPPTVNLTAPADNAKYLAPAAHIKLNAVASDSDGTITKVEFYKDSTLLHTETLIPYGYVWRNVPFGNYTLTAKAYDNSGNVTTSAPVHISVMLDKPPIVSIVKPANNQSYTAPANIHIEASASDTDGRVTNVKFYANLTLLNIQYKLPYTYNWADVPAGTYTITAVATDNWGAHTTSSPVTITVSNAAIVSSKPYSENKKTTVNDAFHLTLSPNPATNIVNIYTSGLQPNKPPTISIISVSGIVLKTMQIMNSSTLLDVSSLIGGVYNIKIISGDKVLYKQFVKL